jgi:hypothetical protein
VLDSSLAGFGPSGLLLMSSGVAGRCSSPGALFYPFWVLTWLELLSPLGAALRGSEFRVLYRFTHCCRGLSMTHRFDEVRRVTDDELLARLERLVKADRAIGVKLLVHLGEVEARKLFLERGYSSMYDYCMTALGMSEAETYLRLLAAKTGKRLPLVLERLAESGLHLTAIKLLAPLLHEENHVALLDRARGMSKRQLEVLVAELAPQPDFPERVRKLPAARGAAVVAAGSAAGAQAPSAVHSLASGGATWRTAISVTAADGGDPLLAADSCDAPLLTAAGNAATTHAAAGSGAPVHSAANGGAPAHTAYGDGALVHTAAASVCGVPRTVAVDISNAPNACGTPAALSHASSAAANSAFSLQPAPPRASISPLSPGRFKLELTLGQEAYDQLEQLRELLRHQNPRGEITCIVERALRELLERTLKQRFAQTASPRRQSARMQGSGVLDSRAGRRASTADAYGSRSGSSTEDYAQGCGGHVDVPSAAGDRAPHAGVVERKPMRPMRLDRSLVGWPWTVRMAAPLVATHARTRVSSRRMPAVLEATPVRLLHLNRMLVVWPWTGRLIATQPLPRVSSRRMPAVQDATPMRLLRLNHSLVVWPRTGRLIATQP